MPQTELYCSLNNGLQVTNPGRHWWVWNVKVLCDFPTIYAWTLYSSEFWQGIFFSVFYALWLCYIGWFATYFLSSYVYHCRLAAKHLCFLPNLKLRNTMRSWKMYAQNWNILIQEHWRTRSKFIYCALECWFIPAFSSLREINVVGACALTSYKEFCLWFVSCTMFSFLFVRH